MFQNLAALLDLSATQAAITIAVVFTAGVVRGFSGFALSALVMASIALMIPPVELIAVCWVLEFSASLFLVGGGLMKSGENILRQSDNTLVLGLLLGGLFGLPLGLAFTNSVSAETSKAVVLSVIIFLSALQLFKVRAPLLATKPGLFGSGILAGVATGLASIGGMVVALYVLAREHAARKMRASMVTYLFASSFITFVFLWWFGMWTQTAISRGALLIVPCLLGVFLGKALFTPRLEPYYKPFCLLLLIGLAVVGLVRLTAGL